MATFGKLTDGASVTAQSVDAKAVSSFTPSTGGVATKITARTWVNGGSTTATAVIYADSAGAPGALLAVSDEVTITTTLEGEIDFPLSGAAQITLVAGTPYWIGIHWKDPGAESWNISRDNTASLTKSSADTYSDGPSDPFGAPTNVGGPIDVYVTYTDVSAALTGTALASITEADIVAGGKTIVITLTGDTFIP